MANSGYMTKRQILKAYNDGDLEACKTQLVRYGVITKDTQFDIESGRYAGANRIYTINHHGMVWRIEMLNGEVRALGHTI